MHLSPTPAIRFLSQCSLWLALLLVAQAGAETPTMHSELITDHSGASTAVGPSAIKWGFMCSIAARHGKNLYAINYTRTPDVAWDTREPNEAPVAFWKRQPNGTWTSTLLDSPVRTYQAPSLLLGPDGRANVFTLKAGGDTIYWFHSQNAQNSEFKCTGIPMEWGAYLGGGIDPQGRALMVYWANYHPDPSKEGFEARMDGYSRSTIGYTLVDTVTGKHKNGTMDSPGAPYCYSNVAYAKNGAHVLTVSDVVSNYLINGSRNHFTEVRYYYSPDPWSDAKWKHVTLYENPLTTVHPVGLEVDHAGRAHLLYWRRDQMPDGKSGPLRLFYAVSREPLSAHTELEFVQHEIKSDGWDGRMFQTRSGHLYILAYRSPAEAQLTEIEDGLAGKFSPWKPLEVPAVQGRIFPIGLRGGSTLTDDLDGVFFGLPGSSAENSMYHFHLPLGKADEASAP